MTTAPKPKKQRVRVINCKLEIVLDADDLPGLLKTKQDLEAIGTVSDWRDRPKMIEVPE